MVKASLKAQITTEMLGRATLSEKDSITTIDVIYLRADSVRSQCGLGAFLSSPTPPVNSGKPAPGTHAIWSDHTKK